MSTHENHNNPNFDPHTHGRSKPANKSFARVCAAVALTAPDPLYVRPKPPEEVAPRLNGSHSWRARWKVMVSGGQP